MNQICIEIDEETQALVERLATLTGMTVSEFSRDALLDYAKKFSRG